ncbi:helix-turn-helix domain-containing protein [Pseudomonas mosselii]|uniref:helix-turn-helix domain-containing protein n=1 Tax=Pseudomonas mosselii TaxID=78327 RepID=UPI000C12CBC3|nr:helix-turn-helix transcriptional regulator [Pseudomonas mosselii]
MNPIVVRLIKHFGTQQSAAKAIGVDQTTISGWLRGKHLISIESAIRIREATHGAFQVIELCPSIARLSPTANETIDPVIAAVQPGEPSVHPSSIETAL